MIPVRPGTRVAWGGMIPQPSAVTPELAEAALNCVPLARARKLAEWIGPSRQLTSSGVLKPALAIEACQVLGIELPPGRLRTALDLDELMQDWEVACYAGYIIPRGSRVRAAARLADMSPLTVLRSWLGAASAELGLRDEPCGGCLTILHELSEADGPLDLAQLAEAIGSPEPPEPEDGPCPGCGEIHDPPDLAAMIGYDDEEEYLDDSREHAEDTVVSLMSYGAVAVLAAEPVGPGGSGETRVRLTPLGAMLAESIFTGCAPPPEADVATLMDVLSALPQKIAEQMAMPWLAARSPAAAAGELLAWAEPADPAQRLIAMAFAMGIGPEAAPAWREWADRPGFGAYARMWLNEHGEEVPEHPEDQAWLTVEALSAANAKISPEAMPLVLGAALGNADAAEASQVLTLISSSGHPDAEWFVESITIATGVEPPTARWTLPAGPARRGRLPAEDHRLSQLIDLAGQAPDQIGEPGGPDHFVGGVHLRQRPPVPRRDPVRDVHRRHLAEPPAGDLHPGQEEPLVLPDDRVPVPHGQGPLVHFRPEGHVGPAGLLGQFPPRPGRVVLPVVQPAARRAPVPPVGRPVVVPEQQHPVLRVEHDHPPRPPQPDRDGSPITGLLHVTHCPSPSTGALTTRASHRQRDQSVCRQS